MVQQAQPVVGEWYRTIGGETFEVVAYDPDDESVDIQYADGTLEEIDLDSWLELDAEAVEPPESWAGSLDLMSEDYGAEDPGAEDQLTPLDELDGF